MDLPMSNYFAKFRFFSLQFMSCFFKVRYFYGWDDTLNGSLLDSDSLDMRAFLLDACKDRSQALNFLSRFWIRLGSFMTSLAERVLFLTFDTTLLWWLLRLRGFCWLEVELRFHRAHELLRVLLDQFFLALLIFRARVLFFILLDTMSLHSFPPWLQTKLLLRKLLVDSQLLQDVRYGHLFL